MKIFQNILQIQHQILQNSELISRNKVLQKPQAFLLTKMLSLINQLIEENLCLHKQK